MTKRDMAELARCSVRCIDRWLDEELLKFRRVKAGGSSKVLILREDALAFLGFGGGQ